jgi:phosphohistidine phosphatase
MRKGRSKGLGRAGKHQMKRLYLLRHAKAVSTEPAQDDHARALTVRGMHDASAMARYLHKNGFTPELVLISTSARTRQTADLVLREITARPDYCEALYLAEAGEILGLVQAAPPGVSALMVVGHNPGLEELATLLAREPVRRKERARRDVLEEKFPTAALAVLDFAIEKWRDISPGEGALVDFARPRDL